MRLTLRGRLFVGLASMVLAVLAVSGALAARHVRSALREALDSTLRARADVVIRLLRDAPGPLDDQPADVRRVFRSRAFDSVRPLRGVVVFDSESGALQTDSPSVRGALAERAIREVRASRRSDRDNVKIEFDAAPGVRLRGGGLYVAGSTRVVLALEDLAGVDEESFDVVAGFGFALPVCVGVALFGAWLASRWIERPIRQIADAVRATEAGRRPVNIPAPGSGDEVDSLARTLEDALRRLDDAAVRESFFAAHAAHELRTPLATIIAQAETCLRRPRGREEYEGALTASLDAARRMNDLVGVLLELARSGGPPVGDAPSDAAEVARSVCEELQPLAAAAGCEVRVVGDGAAPVKASRTAVGILLRNLVRNAVQHAGRPGEVVVETSRDGAFVLISVRDGGVGIAAEHLPHLFDAFYRVDAARSRSTGGAGLGLTLVRSIALTHGGSAMVRSIEGRGTTFEVRLPAPPSAS